MALGGVARDAPGQAHCHLGIGELYLRAERHEAAAEHLRAAAALFESMGIVSLWERADRQLRTRPE
jgi:hypothetical protein